MTLRLRERPFFGRIRQWRESSSANQITFTAVSIAVAATCVVALISFVVIVVEDQQAQNLRNRQTFLRAAEYTERSVEVITSVSRQLSASGLFVSALLDSRGRQIYLEPFIQGFRFPIKAEIGVALCDSNGQKLAGNKSPLSDCTAGTKEFIDSESHRNGIAATQARVVDAATPLLQLLEPIRVPYTNTVDGALVIQIRLLDLIGSLPADFGATDAMLVGSSGGAKKELVATGSRPGYLPAYFEAPVLTPLLEKSGHSLSLKLGFDNLPNQRKPLLLATAYLAGLMLLAWIVARLARQAAYTISSPLTALAAESRRFAQHGDVAFDAPLPSGTPPELLALGTSLRQMADAIRRNKVSLESTITDRTKELREAEASLRSVFDAATDIAIIATDESGNLTLFNSGAETMLGYAGSNVVNQVSLEQIWPRRALPEISANAQEQTSAELVTSLLTIQALHPQKSWESFFLRNDGQPCQIMVSVKALDSSNEGGGIVIVARDITELKKAESANAGLEDSLRQAQKMEAIGTFAGGIAHDFNNILASIIGNASLASQDVGSNKEALTSIAEIQKASIRGRELVQQILSFSRRQRSERLPISLGTTVNEAVKFLRTLLPSTVSVSVTCRDETPIGVFGDAGQLTQVILNLGTNAFQAMYQRTGTISIELSVERDDAQVECACILFDDDGSGIPEEAKKRIFEPFFTTKPLGEGTGLGLSVVHGIVTGHSGSIQIVAKETKGTRFKILLPLTSLPIASPTSSLAQSDALPTAAERRPKQWQLAYLDDDETMVMLVTRLLERRGFEVSGFIDQQRFLEALRQDRERFDLLVTDFNMPRQNGIEVARLAREINPALKIMIASGFVSEELTASAKEVGIKTVIFKATDVDSYCQAIQTAVST